MAVPSSPSAPKRRPPRSGRPAPNQQETSNRVLDDPWTDYPSRRRRQLRMLFHITNLLLGFPASGEFQKLLAKLNLH